MVFQKHTIEEDINYYNRTLMRIMDDYPTKNRLTEAMMVRADSLLELINVEIKKEKTSSDLVNTILKNTLFTKYSFKCEYKHSFVFFENDTLNKLQKEVDFLEIKKRVYHGFYSEYLGCIDLGRPFFYSFSDSNKITGIFGYVDTSYRKKRFYIDEILLNDEKVNPSIEIQHKNGFYEAIIHSKKPGIYKWKGGYEVTRIDGNYDSIPVSGELIIDN